MRAETVASWWPLHLSRHSSTGQRQPLPCWGGPQFPACLPMTSSAPPPSPQKPTVVGLSLELEHHLEGKAIDLDMEGGGKGMQDGSELHSTLAPALHIKGPLRGVCGASPSRDYSYSWPLLCLERPRAMAEPRPARDLPKRNSKGQSCLGDRWPLTGARTAWWG